MQRFAHILVWVMSAECLATSVAFAVSGGWKMAAYWLCAACINGIAGTF